jgi:5-methyltetrahydrofolate--homocysteine methyltransferase
LNQRFNELMKKERIVLDGAMGTMIEALGGDMGKIHSLASPDLIERIHRLYCEAGADIIYASSFNANGYKLHGTEHTVKEAVQAAMTLAKKAAQGTDTLVALGLGPIGRLIEPGGDMTFEEAYEYFKEMIEAGADQADLVVVETLSDLYEAKAAVLAVKENSTLPVVVTMTFEENQRTFTGMSVPAMVVSLEALGVDALGVNCSLGPLEMAPVVQEVCAWATVPVVVKPNAGMPNPETGEYGVNPKAFVEAMMQLEPLGIKMMGGCCGTTPEFIRLLKEKWGEGTTAYIDSSRQTPGNYSGGLRRVTALTTGLNVLPLDQPRIIGERINPTGKKRFKQALIEEDFEYILQQAIQQKEQGAHILDVNVGLPEIHEPSMMARVVKDLQKVVDLPLQIDSADPEALEAGLRVYNGKPIVNSVNGEEKSLCTVLPLVKKYGAAVVGLTLDEEGIPKTSDKRVEIARRILERALSLGIPKEDVYIDCLTLTASSEQSAVMDTLTAVKRVKEELGLKTVLGVSNISFGLPNRELVNRTFLTLALGMGLDLPIINPGDGEMVGAFRATNLLANVDADGREYIQAYQDVMGKSRPQENLREMTLDRAIQQGLKEEGMELTRRLLEQEDPMDIVKNRLVPALDKVGLEFETGEIFLPQLLLSAGVAQGAFEVIKAHMEKLETQREARGTIVLATVKGDIHDIGKNIVKVLLENYDYHVIDLGKDVFAEKILEAVRDSGATLVGLSALMTTTLKSMEKTIAQIHREFPECRVMVGGAVLTAEYAKKLGADYYGGDAKKAVDIANEHFHVV